MFKSKIIFCILFMISFLISQTTWTDDEILNISNTIKQLEVSDSLKTEKIETLETLIRVYERQIELDSLYVNYKDKKLDVLQERIDLLEEQIDFMEPGWYDSKYIWFGYGVLTILVSSKIVQETLR
tara:strand:+ start:2228 stop:2605 length:378 start_codon:yes stop_codon:yes gene_type:complete